MLLSPGSAIWGTGDDEMATYYRIHSADEAPETVLDPTRPRGLGLDPDRVDMLLARWGSR